MQGPPSRTSSEEAAEVLRILRRAYARAALKRRLALVPPAVGALLVAFDPRIGFFIRPPTPLNLAGSLVAVFGFLYTFLTYFQKKTSRGFPRVRRLGFATMSAGLCLMLSDAARAAWPAGGAPVAGYAAAAVLTALSAAYLVWISRFREDRIL